MQLLNSQNILLLGLLCLAVQAIGMGSTASTDTQTLLEANKYYSATDKLTTYDIKNVTQGKALILLLSHTKRHITSPVMVTLNQAQIGTPCRFTKPRQLCVLSNVTVPSIALQIECTSLPCDVEWIIYQPQVKNPNGKQPALSLFPLGEVQGHLLGKVMCNDPGVKAFNKDVRVYANNEYTRAFQDNIVYLMFTNTQKGYAFVNIDGPSRACASVEFVSVPKTIVPGQPIQDFATSQSPLLMDFQSIPESEFRIQVSAKRLQTNAIDKATIIVALTSHDHSQVVASQTVRATNSDRIQDFTVIFEKVEGVERKLGLKISTTGSQTQSLVLKLVTSTPHQVEMGQQVYFQTKTDQELKFKIPSNSDALPEEKVYIIPKKKPEIELSTDSCGVKEGCEFTVKSKAVTDNMLLLSNRNFQATKLDQSGGLYEMDEVKLVAISEGANGYVRAGDRVFLKRKVQANKAIQVLVNTPNVLLYAATAQRCVIPTQMCHQRTGNSHHPFIFSSSSETTLLISVQAIENTPFTLTILSHDHAAIPLQDAVPFAYRMDAKQQQVKFSLTIKEQSQVSFNLVAPLNDLKLTVSNQKGDFDSDEAETSWEGYIVVKKEDLQGKDFTISVAKAKQTEYSTHFTLIASTKHSQVRLESSVTQYQTLQAEQVREMVFEFDPSQQHVLNFYAHDMKEEEISVEVLLGATTDWQKANKLTIERDTDYLDLQGIAQWLCQQQGAGSCELFMRIKNTADHTMDIAVTLLKRESVMQLKDGVWQGLPGTDLATSARFYFYPRHKHKDILLYYSSGLTNLKVSYLLWQYDPDTLSPPSWPYPSSSNSKQATRFIAIDHKQLQESCWPNCVLLVTLQLDRSKPGSKITFQNLPTIHTKIMISNDELQLPAKQQLSFTVGAHQNKQMLVDLTQTLTKQQITFYATNSIGVCSIGVGFYSEQHKNCPAQSEQSSTLQLGWGETKFTTQAINEALTSAEMGDDKEKYLCIMISATDEACKGTIEYSSDSEEEFYPLSTDTFQEVNIDANQTKFFKFDGFIEQSTKVVRESGLPFIAIKKCESQAKLEDCMNEFRASTERGKQLVLKTESFQDQICQECVYLIKLSSYDPARVILHLASPKAQLQLKQKVMLSDFLNQGETNHYQFHADPAEELVVNIHVQQGQIRAQLSDANSINITKTSSEKDKVVQFTVPGKKKDIQEKIQSAKSTGASQWEGLQIYQMEVSSIEMAKAATYSVSYSSGEREVVLQDGLVVKYLLQSHKTASFSYSNTNPHHIYLTLSTQNATALNQLKTSLYKVTDPNDKDTAQELTLQKPTLNKKTPSPTLLFLLPIEQNLQLHVQNPTQTSVTISLLINHREVILLPFNQEFPLQLHSPSSDNQPVQYLNILVDVNIPGHLTLMIRKCDQSSPTLGYTFDYDSFIKQDFMYETQLGGVPFFSYSIKAQRVGTLYLHLQADPLFHSLLSIRVIHSQEKRPAMGLRPTRLSSIDYTLEDESRAMMKVGPVTCHSPPCKGIKYYYMAATDQQQLYSQLVCPGSLFNIPGRTIASPLTLHPLKHQTDQKELQFEVQLPARQAWVGVKAISESGEEYYYQPVQVASLLSKLSRAGSSVHITLFIFLLVIFGMLALVVKGISRRGYQRLREEQD